MLSEHYIVGIVCLKKLGNIPVHRARPGFHCLRRRHEFPIVRGVARVLDGTVFLVMHDGRDPWLILLGRILHADIG